MFTTVDDRPIAAAELASELLGVISPIRRVLRRTLRRAHLEPPLSQAQVEVLVAVQRQPGLCVQEVAGALQLAPNSVSTLVHPLARRGLIGRRQDPKDRRTVRLSVTEDAAQVLAARRAFRHDATERALADLGPDDRRRIEDALPALRHLLTRLEEQEARP